MGGGFGRGHAERVHDDRFFRAGLHRGLVDRLEVAEVGAGAVDAEEGDRNASLGGERDGVHDSLEHRLPVDTERRELPLGDRRLDHACAHAELDERLHISLDGARETPDLGVEAGVADQLDRPPVFLGYARETGFDALDAERV